MPVTTDVKKYAETARAQFVEQWSEAQKPVFAVVGAYDAAFEQARQIPAEVRTLIEELPQQVKSLQDQAVTLYGDLAQRGEKVYATLRRQPAVQDATEAAEKAGDAVKQGGKDTSAAAKKALAKAAQETEETADSAAATAKKGTAAAANSAKSAADKTANKADKAVDAAEQATDDAAEKASQKA